MNNRRQDDPGIILLLKNHDENLKVFGGKIDKLVDTMAAYMSHCSVCSGEIDQRFRPLEEVYKESRDKSIIKKAVKFVLSPTFLIPVILSIILFAMHLTNSIATGQIAVEQQKAKDDIESLKSNAITYDQLTNAIYKARSWFYNNE